MRKYTLITLLIVAFSALPAQSQDAKLDLKSGEHIAILGNNLADRMQHFGYLESMIHAANPEKNLVFRNLGFSADEVTTWHRSQDFGSTDEWLTKTAADIIFLFYGFNESFAGQEGLDDYRSDLDRFLKEKSGKKFSGKENARLVLFSPIAAENTGNPDHPDVTEINQRLKNYTAAMKEIAAANQIPFIDLFTPSLAVYDTTEEPLTLNGIHLTEQGYAAIAPSIFSQLTGADAPKVPEKLRSAVQDKNEIWFSRYRTVDGYNVYGGRSKKVYEDISNFQVMQEEMSQRDVMTANRDERVWALAKGNDLVVKDDNLPQLTEVPTNLPEQRIAPYPDPAEAISKMKVHPGMKVNLFASEKEFPELANPVQMAWDTQNRLWVAAWPSYPALAPTDTVFDKLLIFEDTDQDGRADKMTTFMDGLNCPTGFQFYRDGVLVMQAPDLWFVRDTDGDGKADWKERVLGGIDSADTHHTTNAMCLDPGGGVYLSDGVFHRTQVETTDGPIRNTDGCIYRYEPNTGKFERYMHHRFANPHGRVFDRWGNDLVTDATGNRTFFGGAASGFLSGNDKHESIKEFWERPSRPCPATTILSSTHFPDEFQGNFLNANVISFQGIYRVGVDSSGSGPWGKTLEHFIYTDPADNQHFRPICMANGPDGAMYFCDWSQTIIGHLQHHLRDPNRDHQHGRIYRITYEGRDLADPPLIHGQPIKELLEQLKSPVNGTRELAKIELSKHSATEVAKAAAQWESKLDQSDPEYAHHQMEALWVHQWVNIVNEKLLNKMLQSPEPRARAAAGRVLCHWRDRISNIMELTATMCDDDHPRVRLEGVRLASYLGRENGIAATETALLATKHETDYYLDYVLKETMRELEQYWRPAISEGKAIAADNPSGIAFMMKSVGNKELLKMPKIPAVLTAWLTRPGIPEMKRLEALAGLSESNQSNGAAELVKIIQSGAAESVSGDIGRLLSRQPADELKSVTKGLTAIIAENQNPILKRAALASVCVAEGNVDPLWAHANSPKGLLNALNAIPMISDGEVRKQAHEKALAIAQSIPKSIQAKIGNVKGTSGRIVRISLPRKGTLTLAEVEIFSGGSNIALGGKTSQSSVGASGNPERAIDGNTSGAYGNNGQTHTSENKKNPWWEIDLGGEMPIEAITIWNRTDGKLGSRLEGFTLEILDNTRTPVFTSKENRAPKENVKIEVGGDPAISIRNAAVAALVSTKQDPKGTFNLLTTFIQNGELRNASARGIRQIPRKTWDKETAGKTALAMLDWAKSVPAATRTSQGFIENIQVANTLAGFLPESDASKIRRELRELGVSVFVIRTVHEQLRYDTTRLVVEAGKPFEIVFENDDVMPHNLLISDPGTHIELGTAAMTMPPDKLDNKGRAYIPETKHKIYGATAMLESGEKETLQLTAPKKEGEYEYVCTFPGHAMVMWGKLVVTKDVDAYLKANPNAPDLGLP